MRNVKTAAAVALAVLAVGMATAPQAQAAYIETLEQVGGDVVATGSGSIDLTDLTFNDSETSLSSIAPVVGEILLGSAVSEQVSTYGGATGPSNFGTGGLTFASSGTGAGVAISDESYIGVPLDYVSSSALGTSTATWAGTTLSALGVTVGTYTYTWGIGADADSFTLYAGVNPPAVPEPDSLVLLAAGLAWIALARLRDRESIW